MADWLIASWVLFAENGNGQPPPGCGGGGGMGMWPALIGIIFVFYFLLIRPQRQDQQRRQSMLAGLKKNDRVVTIGGIYGVVTNVHREANEVTIKVDEGTNTKLRMTVASIGQVLTDEMPSPPSSK